MSEPDEPRDYEVGYGKPPKGSQFKKGVSGNRSGRPKKPIDLVSELLQELTAKVTFNEKGKRKTMTKSALAYRQLMNKAATGDIPATRLFIKERQLLQEILAERQKNAARDLDKETDIRNLTDEELMRIIREGYERSCDSEDEK